MTVYNDAFLPKWLSTVSISYGFWVTFDRYVPKFNSLLFKFHLNPLSCFEDETHKRTKT